MKISYINILIKKKLVDMSLTESTANTSKAGSEKKYFIYDPIPLLVVYNKIHNTSAIEFA